MYIKFARRFAKSYDKAPLKIREAFDQRLKLFQQDFSHPLLKNHQLNGKYRGMRSINITGDWRAVYEEIGKDTVYFMELGTHSELYK